MKKKFIARLSIPIIGIALFTNSSSLPIVNQFKASAMDENRKTVLKGRNKRTLPSRRTPDRKRKESFTVKQMLYNSFLIY